jgi:hypothetical protein
MPDDILPCIVAPRLSLREVFELSLFLYGYYDDRHIGIRLTDPALYDAWMKGQAEIPAAGIRFSQRAAYPLFLSAGKLKDAEIDFNGEPFLLSYSHEPTRANYWHFELWTKDSSEVRIPRDKSNTHTRYLARSILEYIVAEAVLTKSEAKRFRREDFDVFADRQ